MPRGKVGTSPISKKSESKKSGSAKKSTSTAKESLKTAKRALKNASPVKVKTPKVRIASVRDSVHRITDPAIRRLLRRASVKRISLPIYEEVRSVLRAYAGVIVRKTVIMTEAARRKTVKRGDLEAALSSMGIDMVAGVSKTGETKSLRSSNHRSSRGAEEPKVAEPKTEEKKTRRRRPGNLAMSDIRNQQKQESLCIAVLNFDVLVREICQENTTEDIRFEKDVIKIIQLAVESFLIKTCHLANLIALSSSRQTIIPNDIRLVLMIQGSKY